MVATTGFSLNEFLQLQAGVEETAPPEIWTGGARTPLKFAEIFEFYRCEANCLCPHPGVYCQSNYRRAGCLCN